MVLLVLAAVTFIYWGRRSKATRAVEAPGKEYDAGEQKDAVVGYGPFGGQQKVELSGRAAQKWGPSVHEMGAGDDARLVELPAGGRT
jgi:hypothetical protein